MGLSSFLYTFASPFTRGDLAVVSNTRDEWWEVFVLLGWKAAQLAVSWYGGYDSTSRKILRSWDLMLKSILQAPMSQL